MLKWGPEIWLGLSSGEPIPYHFTGGLPST